MTPLFDKDEYSGRIRIYNFLINKIVVNFRKSVCTMKFLYNRGQQGIYY
jgi:hypothetical protein